MQEQKKRTVFVPEWGPPEQEEKKTIPKPPETEGITNQLKEAEQSMGDLIDICSVCFKHGCHQAPAIWVRADDKRIKGYI